MCLISAYSIDTEQSTNSVTISCSCLVLIQTPSLSLPAHCSVSLAVAVLGIVNNSIQYIIITNPFKLAIHF